jgi:hypothetical protein
VRVFAVVANWNGGRDNLACLDSLFAGGLDPSQVVFVDNGSEDGSAGLVEERHPRVHVLRNEGNLGFGEASNQGARLALALGAEAVFFVNNDVLLPVGVLLRLVLELEREPRAGIVGPRVLQREARDKVWSAGGMLTWRQNLSTRDVDYVAGCTLLARRGVLESAGLFDPEYFAYMEDIDLCLRARQAGWLVRVVGEVCAYHAASSSTGGGYNPRRKYMMGVNSVWFLRRHAGRAEWLRFVWFDVLPLPFLYLASLVRGRPRSVIAKALGILDGLRGRRVTAAAIREGTSWLW